MRHVSLQLLFCALFAGVACAEQADDAPARFTREFIGALQRQDAVAMALLTRFPLRVNLPDHTTILIADENTLKRRFGEVFPPAFRKFVLDAEKAGSGENGWAGAGYMLDHGAAWAQNSDVDGAPRRLRLDTINAGVGADSAPRPDVLFTCETSVHRIVIDGKRDALRYRAWNTPHFPPAAPDFTLTKGEETISGTSGCSHATYDFLSGDTAITVNETGCAPGRGRAEVAVRIKGEVETTLACY